MGAQGDLECTALLTALREEENSPGKSDSRHGFGCQVKPVGWGECGLSAHGAAERHVLPGGRAGCPWSHRYTH